MSGYIYIFHIREFFTQNIPVYKIGRAIDIFQRKNGYPKGSKLLFCMEVSDMILIERELIDKLKQCCIQRTDLGREYFEGDINTIKQELMNICMISLSTDSCSSNTYYSNLLLNKIKTGQITNVNLRSDGPWYGDDIHIDYPLIRDNNEIIPFSHAASVGYDLIQTLRRIPTMEECISNNLQPMLKMDVLDSYKGRFLTGIKFYDNALDKLTDDELLLFHELFQKNLFVINLTAFTLFHNKNIHFQLTDILDGRYYERIKRLINNTQ